MVGAKITAAPLSMNPGTAFSRRMNWERALAQSSFMRDSDAWARLERLVADHDQPDVDELIVAAGAPVVAGLAYPGDEILAAAIIRVAASRSIATRHIEPVFVHAWSRRAVFELTPGRHGITHVCGERPLP